MPSFDALLASGAQVVGAITNPDKPAGRGLRLNPPPVKRRAEEAGVCVYQPSRARAPEVLEWLQRAAPEVAVVVAYGSILPQELLDVPPLGFLNVHFSLLPSYRGAAPVQRAIMDGAAATGVTIMVLTAGMDEGPLLASRSVPIAPDDTAGTLGARLATLGADLLVPTLESYAAGALVAEQQDNERATYAPRITSSEARIDWSASATSIHNHIRGLNPDPGAWTTLRGARLKVHAAELAAEPPSLAPGEVASGTRLLAGTGDGDLVLTEVQPAGKRTMPGDAFARGLRLKPSEGFK